MRNAHKILVMKVHWRCDRRLKGKMVRMEL